MYASLKVLGVLELELQTVGRCHVGVGIELRSSGRVSALNHSAIYLSCAPILHIVRELQGVLHL